jgi:hypothetical protein
MSGLLSFAPRTIRIVAWCGLFNLFLAAQPACAWQAPPGTSPDMSSGSLNPRGNRQKDLASRPAAEILQSDSPLLVENRVPVATTDRLTASDIFLLKIVGAILMASLATLIGLKFLFSHGRKARSPIVGPPPMGSGPPDPDGLRWLSGTVREVTKRDASRRRGGPAESDSSDQLAKPASGSSGRGSHDS